MVCLDPANENWILAGISNWRIACSSNSAQRPRMYDKVISNVHWVKETINSDSIPVAG